MTFDVTIERIKTDGHNVLVEHTNVERIMNVPNIGSVTLWLDTGETAKEPGRIVSVTDATPIEDD